MTQFTLTSAQDGLALHGLLVVPPSGQVRGVVQISHGMAEHKQRYLPFMRYLAKHGFACAIHDHRGHGQSVRDSAHWGYFYAHGATAVVEDLKQVTEYLQEKFPEAPFYLFGHSMGSLIARVYCKTYDDRLDGLILCGSPSENKLAGLGKLLVRVLKLRYGPYHRSKLIQTMAFGSFVRGIDISQSKCAWICTDERVVRAYDADPACGFTFTLNGFENLFTLMQRAYSPRGWQVKNPSLPVFFISGSQDPCRVSDRAFLKAVHFLRRRGYHQVEWKEYAAARHELLNETGKARVFADVLSFLRYHPGADKQSD